MCDRIAGVQSPPAPALATIFGADTINTVTIRELASMQSGLGDYDSGRLQAWTTEHPSEDYAPLQYITDLAKHGGRAFAFPPGKGSEYSSDGIVLLGKVRPFIQSQRCNEHQQCFTSSLC